MRPALGCWLALLITMTASPARATLAPGSWSPTGGQVNAHFGAAVAPAGDVNADGFGDVLVGAPGFDNGQLDEGRVFLFYGSATGLAPTAAWTWEPNEEAAAAGAAVAPAGDINNDGYADFLVGAPFWDAPGTTDAGGVFVFLGSALGPAATPSDTLVNGFDFSHFGAAVCTAGDVNGDQFADVIVGAPDLGSSAAGGGGVYVYLGSAGGLGANPVFTLESNQADAHLGAAVSGAGDVNADSFADILVGAPGTSGGGNVGSGRAWVYRGNAGGIGTALATIGGTADSMATGSSVANAGDVNGDGYADIVIGSPGANDNFIRRTGHANIYAGSATGIVAAPILSIDGLDSDQRMGTQVATAGDVDGDGYADVLIDRERYPAPEAETGEVLVAIGGRLGPNLDSTLSGFETGAGYAAVIATGGDFNADGYSEVLVGSPTFSGSGDFGQGAVFSYLGSASPPVVAGNTPLSATGSGTDYGRAIAVLPHVESDLFPALLIGEPVAGPSLEGRVELRHAQWGSIKTFAAHTYTGTEPDELFGFRVVDAGDVNRDTWTDFLIASPLFDGGGAPDRGKVTLYLGGSAGPSVSPWVAAGDQASEAFGRVVAGRGDVNGDGYHDVLIAAPDWDSPTAVDCGKVWFYPGSASGPGAASWSRSGTAAGERFGTDVALVGDLDADGYSDVAISAESVPVGSARVEVWFGGPTGLTSAPGWTLTASPPRDSFSHVAGVGDIDGDGVGDLIVGSPRDNLSRGMVFAYRGSRGRVQPATPYWTYSGPDGAQAGFSVGGGGDLNGDGRADVMVGEPGFTNGQGAEGRILVFHGRRLLQQSTLPSPDLLYESEVAGNLLGTALAPLSDVNLDGFADLVAGAPGGTGRVLVKFGGGEGTPQQLFETEANFGGIYRSPPALLDNQTNYGVGQTLRTAAGRDRVDVENEVVLQGNAFTGLLNRYATGSTTGPPGSLGSTGTTSYSLPAPFKATTSRVRSRTRTRSPYFPRSRWMSIESRVSGEYDFRTGGTTTSVDAGTIASARIVRVAPNPVRSRAAVAFTLPARAVAQLDVFDVAGRHVRRLARQEFPAGANASNWDGADDRGRSVAAGIYFIELRVDSGIDRSRIVRLR